MIDRFYIKSIPADMAEAIAKSKIPVTVYKKGRKTNKKKIPKKD